MRWDELKPEPAATVLQKAYALKPERIGARSFCTLKKKNKKKKRRKKKKKKKMTTTTTLPSPFTSHHKWRILSIRFLYKSGGGPVDNDRTS
jgi:hypothetical protein